MAETRTRIMSRDRQKDTHTGSTTLLSPKPLESVLSRYHHQDHHFNCQKYFFHLSLPLSQYETTTGGPTTSSEVGLPLCSIMIFPGADSNASRFLPVLVFFRSSPTRLQPHLDRSYL